MIDSAVGGYVIMLVLLSYVVAIPLTIVWNVVVVSAISVARKIDYWLVYLFVLSMCITWNFILFCSALAIDELL